MRKLVLIAVAVATLSSCSGVYVAVTNNPIGTKVGKVSGLKDANIGNAAKNGGITKIGTVKYQYKGAKSVIVVTGN